MRRPLPLQVEAEAKAEAKADTDTEADANADAVVCATANSAELSQFMCRPVDRRMKSIGRTDLIGLFRRKPNFALCVATNTTHLRQCCSN